MALISPQNSWLQFSGSRWSKLVLKLFGWKLNFPGLPSSHGILLVYPHTSNMDFFIGMLAKWAIGMPVYFLAKDSLFRIPLLGWWLRVVGGRAVIRTSPQGYVAALAAEMKANNHFWIAITPEGTRSKTPGWRSGFYRLAISTGYPVGFAYLDYKNKEIGVKQFAYLEGAEEKDWDLMAEAYEGIMGCYPENMAPIKMWSPAQPKNEVQ